MMISILVPSRHFRERSSDNLGFVAVKRKTVKVSVIDNMQPKSDKVKWLIQQHAHITKGKLVKMLQHKDGMKYIQEGQWLSSST